MKVLYFAKLLKKKKKSHELNEIICGLPSCSICFGAHPFGGWLVCDKYLWEQWPGEVQGAQFSLNVR